MTMPETIKVGPYNFELYRGQGHHRPSYNGFCLSTSGIYLSRIACKEYQDTDWVRIDYDIEKNIIKLSTSIPGSHHLGRSRDQIYMATIQLQKILPTGRYVYKFNHDGGKCYQLESKVESNQPIQQKNDNTPN